MSIKVRKAQQLAAHLPMAETEIWRSIPPELIERLTAYELALVAQALDKHWHKAQAHKEREIVGEGYVWSAQHNALLDVVYPNA